MSTSPPTRCLLQCDGQDYGFAEVLAAAELRGELAPRVEDFEGREAARSRVDNRTLQRALTRFRTARRLTAADDFKAWMAQRALSLDDVADHLERAMATPGEERGAGAGAEGLYAELVCTGVLDLWMVALGRRLACLADAPVAPEVEVDAAGPPVPLEPDAWRRLQQAEHLGREREEVSLTDVRVRRLLETRKLELIRVELDVMEVDDVDVARELRLCLVIDQEEVASVVERSGARSGRSAAFNAELPRELQREILAAVSGDVIGPITTGTGARVLRVAKKSLPSVADPVVREKLEGELRRRAYGNLLPRHVTWTAWRPLGQGS